VTPVELLVLAAPWRPVDRERYTARCPAHDDRVASLSVAKGSDGRALVKCFAGCTVKRLPRRRDSKFGTFPADGSDSP